MNTWRLKIMVVVEREMARSAGRLLPVLTTSGFKVLLPRQEDHGMRRSPEREVELLMRIARFALEEAAKLRAEDPYLDRGDFTREYLADKVESVARAAEVSIWKIQKDQRKFEYVLI